jgi:hypothetical protein
VLWALQCGCTEDVVRSHFTKLRNTVRSFIQRAHRRAGGRSAPAAAHATGQVQIACSYSALSMYRLSRLKQVPARRCLGNHLQCGSPRKPGMLVVRPAGCV